MTRTLALITILAALSACGDASQKEQRASLASNTAQWETLIASDTMAYVNNRNLIQMR